MDIATAFINPIILLAIGKWLEIKMEAKHEKQQKTEQEKQEAEKELKDIINLLTEGETCILRDRILQSCNYFIGQQKITPLALENISKMHDAYKALGGNGLCDRVFKEINELEVTK